MTGIHRPVLLDAGNTGVLAAGVGASAADVTGRTDIAADTIGEPIEERLADSQL